VKEFPVRDIPHDSYFTRNTYLDKGFVITAPEMPFIMDYSVMLEKWSFKTIYSDGEAGRDYVMDNDEIAYTVGSKFLHQSDNDKIEKAEEFYTGFLYYMENMFMRITVSEEYDQKAITEKIKEIVEYIREDRRFLIRILKNNEPAEGKNYLATHSVRSTILSIVIGSFLKLPPYRLIELGIAAVLHEVGMLKLPSQIYLSYRPLDAKEQKAILTHPILGYTMLKTNNFPLAVCLATLEHHERENGTGYPRKLSGDKISLYSKIIAVACSYEALSSSRPHKEAKDGYTGMLELLKNEGKQYDDTVIKALVLSLSIYPIGLYVLLSNGKKGQVVDVNPENPRFPIVQVFGEYTPDGRIKTVQTAQEALSIARPLSRMEIDT